VAYLKPIISFYLEVLKTGHLTYTNTAFLWPVLDHEASSGSMSNE
jgi:hypothetical protein